MTQLSDDDIERLATDFYERELRPTLEVAHLHEFVAIEPVSGNWFIGKSMREATRQARQACPGQLSFVIRVGHRAALHIGGFDK